MYGGGRNIKTEELGVSRFEIHLGEFKHLCEPRATMSLRRQTCDVPGEWRTNTEASLSVEERKALVVLLGYW